MNKSSKSLALALVFILIFAALYYLQKGSKKPEILEVPYSMFLEQVREGNVAEVLIMENDIKYILKNNKMCHTFIPYNDINLISLLSQKKVKFTGIPKREPSIFWQIINQLIPWLLILGVFWLFMYSSFRGPGGKVFSFGKSRAKLLQPDDSKKKITFKDVAGEEEAKQELQEIIEFLQDPKKFQKLGAKIPKGVLLIGPPGTGKTLMAKAVAGEAGVAFFSISGSDFVEMFVGVGASRVRDLFEQGKRNAPCILFIDEIDAVGRHRGAGIGGGHDEREQTLNQLLVEMDGFDSKEGVIIIAATNRPDVLDPALLRPGRFDRQVVVDIPDVKGREGILKVHSKNIPLADTVNLETIARGTPGFTGADLANLINEAALLAARRDKKVVEMVELEEAKDKVMMGPERRSLVINEQEKRVTAYHESGHALLGKLLPNADPIHKVTIIPRGRALGLTQSLPVNEKHNYSKEYWSDIIVMLLGGRSAEEIKFKSITTGAKNDIEKATDIARKMVCEWGMSALGPLSFAQPPEQIFLGREITQHKDYSEQTAVHIDREIKKIITQCYNKAYKMIKENWESLENLAETLLEKEVLDAEEIDQIIKKKKST